MRPSHLRRGLQIFLTILGSVAFLAGASTALLGTVSILGAEGVSGTVDSEMRFYAVWYAAVGLAILRAVPRVGSEGFLLRAVGIVFFAGGCVRALSWATVGRPHGLAITLMFVELALPFVIIPWQAAVASNAARERSPSRSARFYDALYSWKDYDDEAGQIHRLIQEHSPGAATLLDVACGTGRHLKYLERHYDVEGLDADPGMVSAARELLPEAAIHEADMRTFDLGKRFDAVTCLFSSIAYVHSERELTATLKRLAAHVADSGIVLVEAWITPEAWEPDNLHAIFVDREDLKIARISRPRLEDRTSILEPHYLIGTRDEGVEHFTEEHRLLLFTHEEYLDAFEAAGLDVIYDPDGLTRRGLYIGRLRRAQILGD